MTEWFNLPNNQKIGDFWVMDQETGWAYWASMLEPEEATSYLLDAAEMTSAIEDTVFNGTYYYGIHVGSQLISPDNSEEFTNDGENHDSNLDYFLEGVQNNAVDDDFGNPAYDENSAPSDFNFHLMNPGRIFMMENEEYRYLEDMGNGDHLIIRNDAIRNVSWNEQEAELTSWYGQLDSTVQAMVQPTANSFTTGDIEDTDGTFPESEEITRWTLDLEGDVAADITQVVSGGTRRAFALSLADVTRLSGEGLAFPNHAQRAGANDSWWWLSTPAPGDAWRVFNNGRLQGAQNRITSDINGGIRPALIINQAN